MSSHNRPLHKDRKYSDLTMKQKRRIAEKTYEKHLRFYLENDRMPYMEETDEICRQLFQSVKGLAPMASYEEFVALVRKRSERYEDRIRNDMEKGITLETLNEKHRKKTPKEKATIQKQKNANRRRRHLKKKQEALRQNLQSLEQDDRFFFIAGYTSGGAPYGITWEEIEEPIDDGAESWPAEVNYDTLPFD